jgi:GntR family transcriptional regulator
VHDDDSNTEQIRSEQLNAVIRADPCCPTLADVVVDHDSPVPAYRQLATILRDRLKAGEWKHGPLPSVRQLQHDCGVGRDTVLKALKELADEGLIFSVPARGYYRSSQP